MKPDLTVQIGKCKFNNPVWVASGTFGYAKEFDKFFDLKKLGAIVTKTLTLKPRTGNPPQRVYETPSGMLNAIGLQNVGSKAFLQDKLPFMQSLGVPILASVMAHDLDEFSEVVRVLDSHSGIAGFELNLSCPNVKYAARNSVKMFAHDAHQIREVVERVRKVTKKTLIAKLGPDVSDIGEMAKAAESGGADAVSLINTFTAMVIDIKKRRPYLKNYTGGLSGPCIRPIAVRMVRDAAQAVRIPVIGMGGIMNSRDVLEFVIAGAACVQVGTANFVNPTVCPEILNGLNRYLTQNKIASIRELIGSVQET